jgi:hypothetical protein
MIMMSRARILSVCAAAASLLQAQAFAGTGHMLNKMLAGYTPHPTISVRNCLIYKNDKPYRAIGVDYYTAFYRTYPNTGGAAHPIPATGTNSFASLQTAGIPFIRLPILAYWPNDISPFITSQSTYFAAFDPFIAAAKQYNIGLIVTFIWRIPSIPDHFSESPSAWGNPASQSRAFLASFAAAFADRYKGNNALWAYEFANEFNVVGDISTGYQAYDVSTASGTAASYSSADNLTSTNIKNAYQAFVNAIRSKDSLTPISSGHHMPRTNAYNLRLSLGGYDTVAQFNIEIPWEIAPGNIASFHLYPESWSLPFAGNQIQPQAYFPYAVTAAAGAVPCQPTFFGEYNSINDGTTWGGSTGSYNEFTLLTDSIVSSNVSLAAVWEYDNIYWTDLYNVDSARLSYLTTVNSTLH